MRFLLVFTIAFLFCFSSKVQAENSPQPVTSILVDSVHHVDCRHASGYIAVSGIGGAAPYTYLWSNGQTGHINAGLTPGIYHVTTTDAMGATASNTIAIDDNLIYPDADAGADFTAVCSNSVLQLSGSADSGSEFRYAWAATNGGIIQSGATTLTPTIRHTGTFTLQVTNENNGCISNSAITVDAANEPPAVSASGGVFTCAQPLVTLTGNFSLLHARYSWSGPNGFMSQSLQPAVGQIGLYTLKVTDTLSTCFNTATAMVSADTSKPVFPVTGGVLTCTQTTVQLSGSALPIGVTFSWKGPGNFTSSLQNPIVNLAGTYSVTVTNPTNGCSTTKSAVVTSNLTAPVVTAGVSGAITCLTSTVQLLGNGSPAGVTFRWTGPNGFVSLLQSPSTNVAGPYVLTATNPANGCTSTGSVTVNLNNTPPGATATGGVRNCYNSTVTLQATSQTPGVTYKWAGPSGFNSTQQNPVATNPGTYTVTVTNPANGCTSTSTASLTQNFTPPNLTATTALINCYNPAPNIVAASQTPGVTFSWTGPNGFNAAIPNPVVTAVGFYTVTALNPVNGCVSSTSVLVSDNFATPNVYAGDDRSLNCNFSSILANPIGTSTGNNISYQWTTWDGNIFSGANILYARFDAPGHYTLTVRNTTSGCTVQDSMEVIQTPPPNAQIVQTSQISCNGNTNAALQATVTDGAWPYTYLWSTGQTSAQLSGLGAGIYILTVTDSEGCTGVKSTEVFQPGVLQANTTATGQTQVGLNNGTATVTPNGGTAPYTVKWSNNATTFTINGLAPGQYVVTVTDSRGCTKSNTATVNSVNCTINGTISAINPLCGGVSNGTATANISGAVGQVNYLWSNGGQSATISNLAAGVYTVTATSSNGCSIVLNTQVTSPQPLSIAIVSQTNPTCTGATTGSVMVNAGGGTVPHQFAWSNGANGATLNNLAAGSYQCTVTDNNGCTAVLNVQITAPQTLVLSVGAVVNIPCIDSQNGAITMTASGGAAPLTYTWSNSFSGSAISGIGAGTYTCSVSDFYGCTAVQSAQISITDQTPPQLVLGNAVVSLDASGSATLSPAMFDLGSFDNACGITSWSINPTSLNCTQLGARVVTLTATDKNGNAATGTATVTVSDQIAPVLNCPPNQQVSSCGPVVFFNTPEIVDNCQPLQPPVQTNGLPSGSAFPQGTTIQQFSYTDAGGNTANCQFSITVSGVLTTNISFTPVSCSGSCDGSAAVTIQGGGTPASVIWSSGQTTAQLNNLCPGTYWATVTDASGCSEVLSTTIQVNDTQAPTVVCPGNIVAGTCNATVQYASPQVFDNCAVNPQQLQLLSGLPSGATFPTGTTNQIFQYVDNSGNQGQCSFSVTIQPQATVNLSSVNAGCAGACNGSSSLSINGGQGPFNILWSNGVTGASNQQLCAGTYAATVIDGNGCQQVHTALISQPQAILVSNVFITNDPLNTGSGGIQLTVFGGQMPYTFQWSRNGQPFSTTEDLSNLYPGTYVLMITDASGCVFTSPAYVVSSAVSSQEPENNPGWEVFPNPASAQLQIRFSEGWSGAEVAISAVDLSGRLLMYRAIPTATAVQMLDISLLPAGLFILKIESEFGISSKKIIKTDY